MEHTQHLIFWGAGATAALGIRTTIQQAGFIRHIAFENGMLPLETRIRNALGPNTPEYWVNALVDLITVLGDTPEAYDSINRVDQAQLEAMGRNWQNGTGKEELERRIISLRLIYDWPALKSVVKICPGSSSENFKINDLFNLLDMHIPPGFGFRAPAGQGETGIEQFFDARRLIGAKNALLMVLIASFYIDYQICISSKPDLLHQYYDFATLIGRRMQRQGLNLATDYPLYEPDFYKGDISFVSLNYDPILLWLQFNVHRELNKAATAPHIGSVAAPLHLFHDFGHLIPARRIGKEKFNWPWYPMNEAAAQRLNEQGTTDARFRLTKFLFPHGCLCWRECPDCGKLSTYHGDQWGLDAQGLFPPPPLRAFDKNSCPEWVTGKEREEREMGKVDARQCLHCSTVTYAHQTQAIMQSSFKRQPPSFIEEIDRDLRATMMKANHIIFMGYSLPPDDVTYRAFFAARSQRSKDVHCSVIDLNPKRPDWYGPEDLNQIIKDFPGDFPENHGIRAARDIFGKDKVRFYGGGVPNVFLENGRVTDAALEKLLNWSF